MQTSVGDRLRAVALGMSAPFKRPRRGAGGLPDRAPSVEAYWGEHTVNPKEFATPEESAAYLEWRFAEYPRFRELMELWGDHDDDVVLDFGCGPGDDVLGFLLYARPARVVGVDVSAWALGLAAGRLALHGIDPERFALVHTPEAPCLRLDDASVDFLHSGGVLHHVSDPERALNELRRVLRSDARANVMVYNRDSIWFHLYAGYVRTVVEGAFPGLSPEDAFARTTDGERCPISRAFAPPDFLELARSAGFDGVYVGGYLSRLELEVLRGWLDRALADHRLRPEQRAFLERIHLDDEGLPRIDGKYPGIGGCYRLQAA